MKNGFVVNEMKISPLTEQLADDACGTRKHVPAVWQFYDRELENFVQLIAKQCIDLLMKPEHPMTHPEELSRYNEGWVRGRLMAIEQIKQHFGIHTNAQ